MTIRQIENLVANKQIKRKRPTAITIFLAEMINEEFGEQVATATRVGVVLHANFETSRTPFERRSEYLHPSIQSLIGEFPRRFITDEILVVQTLQKYLR